MARLKCNTHLCPLAGSNAHTLFSFVDSSSSLRLKLRTRLLSTTCAYFDRSSALRRGQDLDQSETAWAALHDERARLLLSKIVPYKLQLFFMIFIIQLFKNPFNHSYHAYSIKIILAKKPKCGKSRKFDIANFHETHQKASLDNFC